MQFRYDFGEKLDLVRIRKSATHYIGTMRQLTFELFVKDFKVTADIAAVDDSNDHAVSIQILELTRDLDGEIKTGKAIYPMNDLRFKEIKDIQSLFEENEDSAHFNSNSAVQTVDKMCRILNVVHRINKLRAFL